MPYLIQNITNLKNRKPFSVFINGVEVKPNNTVIVSDKTNDLYKMQARKEITIQYINNSTFVNLTTEPKPEVKETVVIIKEEVKQEEQEISQEEVIETEESEETISKRKNSKKIKPTE